MKRLLAMVLVLGFVLGNMGCVGTVAPSPKPSIPQHTAPETHPEQTWATLPTVEETQIPTTEPTETEPTETEPTETEPTSTEPTETAPTETEPTVTEPPATEPPATEPPATEPPATEPPATEPPATEPPPTEPPVVYEGMETVFGSTWVATCNKSMALRAYASTDAWSKATIYPGDTLILLEWKGKFAHVAHNGKDGYVLCQYIKPAQEDPFAQYLSLVCPDSCYTYEELTADLQEFVQIYPDLITLDSIGQSHWGTEIPVMCIGNVDAPTQILVQAAIHGREHITAWLTMALAEYWIKTSQAEFDSVCIRLIPMMNPDGVKTSQTKTLTQEQLEIYHSDVANGHTDLSREEYALMWKANGVGIDLNRNFDAGWNHCDDRKGPSSMLYAGTEPFSALEAAALRDYTLSFDADVTLSFHTCGNLIFYDYGNHPDTNRLSKSLAEKIRSRNGYWLECYTSTDSGGYKDWTIESLQIPSLTIEVGNLQPVEFDRESYYIFARNCDIFAITAKWLTD